MTLTRNTTDPLGANPPDKSDWTRIQLRTPIPMEVAGAVMQLIASAWPEAMAVNSDQSNELAMLVPPAPPKRVNKRQAKAARKEADALASNARDSHTETDFLGFNDGWVRTAAPEELSMRLSEIAYRIINAHEEAINYVEWEVRSKPGTEKPFAFVISISRSKGQRPHELRMKAEARVEQLETLLRENGIEVP